MKKAVFLKKTASLVQHDYGYARLLHDQPRMLQSLFVSAFSKRANVDVSSLICFGFFKKASTPAAQASVS